MEDEKPIGEAVVKKSPIYNVTTLNDSPLGEVLQYEVTIEGFTFAVEDE